MSKFNATRLGLLLCAFLVSFLAIVGTAGAASASTVPASPASSISASARAVTASSGSLENQNVCDPVDYTERDANGDTDKAAGSSQWLPVNRWSGASSDFHTRSGGGYFSLNASASFRSALLGMGMSAGNTLTGLSTDLASTAINFCVMNKLGGMFDQVSYTLGNIIVKSTLLTMALVASVIVLVWRAVRGGGNGVGAVKGLFQKAMIVGLFGIMLAGAHASTGGGIGNTDAQRSANYNPGTGSPGWIATKINDTLAELASAPGAAVALGTFDTQSNSTKIDGGDTLDSRTGSKWRSCSAYIGNLRSQYMKTYGNGAAKTRAMVPMTMSSIWETTGMQAWRAAQFGDTPYSESVYCRILENNASKSPHVQALRLKEVGAPAGLKETSSAVFARRDANDQTDRSLVAWAACDYTGGSWKVKQILTASETTATDASKCADWWNKSATTEDGDSFDWESGTGKINERLQFKDTAGATSTEVNEAKDFLTALHQTKNISGITAVLSYVIASVCLLVVFGGISIAIIISKIAALMLILAAFFVLLLSLFPNSDGSKVTAYFKSFVGVSLFAFAGQFIFMLISLISSLLVNVSKALLPGGAFGPVQMLWAGLSPLMAVLIINYMFKNILKVPSPFKMSGGLAWAGAGAAAGGAAAHSMDRMQDRMGRRAGGAIASKMGVSKGGGTERKGKMDADPSRKFDPLDKNRDGKVDAGEMVEGYRKENGGGSAGDAGKQSMKDSYAKSRGEGVNKGLAGAAAGIAGGASYVSTKVGNGMSEVKGAVGRRVSGAASSFKEKPFRTTAKYAAVGALTVATGGAAGLAYGGYKAAKGVSTTAKEMSPAERAIREQGKAAAWNEKRVTQQKEADDSKKRHDDANEKSKAADAQAAKDKAHRDAEDAKNRGQQQESNRQERLERQKRTSAPTGPMPGQEAFPDDEAQPALF